MKLKLKLDYEQNTALITMKNLTVLQYQVISELLQHVVLGGCITAPSLLQQEVDEMLHDMAHSSALNDIELPELSVTAVVQHDDVEVLIRTPLLYVEVDE